MTDPAGTPSRRGAVLAAAASLPLVLRVLSYTPRILDRDETYWLASAMRMQAADLPVYVAGWDTKPPLAFLFHRLALAVAPGAPLLAAHVLGAVLAACACVLVADTARRLAGNGAALLAALAFALLDSTGPVRAMAANTELLAYVPVAVMAWAITTGRPRGAWLPFVAGACSAIAFLAKHPAALHAPFALAAILLAARDDRPPVRSAVAGLAGVAAVLGVSFGWIAAAGAWDDFVACNVTMSLHRAKAGADLAKSYDWGRWLGVAKANVPAIVGVAAVVVGAFRGARDTSRRTLRAVGPVAVAGALAAIAGGAAFQHYLQLAYVPFAILAGVGLAVLPAVAMRAAPAPKWIVAAGALCFAAAAPDRLGQWRSRDWGGYDDGPIPALRDAVRAAVPESGTIFVWGVHPDLYVTVGRAPATRFVSAGWLVGTYTGAAPAPGEEPAEFVPGSWDLLFRDLDASRPAVVIDSAPAGAHGFEAYPAERFPRLRAWLEAGYVREPGPGGYAVWRRR